MLLLFTEFNTGLASDTAVTLFKRGSESLVEEKSSATDNDDEEKARPDHLPPAIDEKRIDAEVEKALAKRPRSANAFTWQHITYVVPIAGQENRKLLDDISGYVVPGKLTALMGESGAGKVRVSLGA